MTSKQKTPYILLVPFFLLLAGFWLVPIMSGFGLSLRSNTMVGEGEFVGFENYLNILQDDRFWKACGNTLFYAFVVIVTVLPLAILLAKGVSLTWKRLRPLFNFLLVFPALAPPTVLAVLFLLVFYGRSGLLNDWLITPFGFKPIQWLKDPNFILWGLILQAIWRWTGFITFFVLSALESIPKVYYEVAELEVKTSIKTFFSITLPSIWRVVLFCGIYLFIDATVTFAGAYILLGPSGGTLDAGLLLVTYTYQKFHFGESATAAAMSFTVMPVLLLFLAGLFFFKPFQKREMKVT